MIVFRMKLSKNIPITLKHLWGLSIGIKALPLMSWILRLIGTKATFCTLLLT